MPCVWQMVWLKGIITRELHTVNGIDKSVIDLVIFSHDLREHMEYIHIDDNREHVLTKIVKTKNGKERTESDHNITNVKFNLTWTPSEQEQVTSFNYNDKEAKKNFKLETTNTQELTQIVDMNKPIDVVTNKLLKRLKGFIHSSFKKVKISKSPDKVLESLYNKRNLLRSKDDSKSRDELEVVEEELANKYSDNMYNKMKNQLKNCTDSDEGGFNTGALWKLKKKLSPRLNEPPTAMQNSKGKLLTNEKDIREEAMNHYKKVFTDKSIGKEYEQYRIEREALCMKHLDECSKVKTPDWTVSEVTYALKCLKRGKSKDPYDIPNELFKPDVAGTNLISAITKLMNRVKSELIFPTHLNVANVTNLYKNKGDKSKFDSYRGIFRIPILRNTLELLMHIDEYEKIDANLTNGNVGARRRRNVRDNLFVINAIMNESKQNKEPTDIDVYDVEKCFDNLWLHESINDLYEEGRKNDKLNLLFLANKDARIVIKTSSGNTEQFSISNTIMQGTVWAGLMCTATMDKLCKRFYKEDNLLYKYRQEVSVPPLEMVDDIITASKCGTTSITINSMVQTFVNQKKLQLSEVKCKKIHIGTKHSGENCAEHYVGENPMKTSEKEKYLGDFLTKDANSKQTIKERKSRGFAVLSQMDAILSDIPLGKYRMEMGLELRHAWFLNGVLFNSETWMGYSDNDLSDLELIDHKILRLIIGSHSKVNTEMLYLETGEITIPNVISVRRLLYFQTLLKRHDKEVTKQVLTSMTKIPMKDDWIHLLKKDLNKVDMTVDNSHVIQIMSKNFSKMCEE